MVWPSRVVQQTGRDDHLAAHAFGVGAQQLLGQDVKPKVEKGQKLLDSDSRRFRWDAIQGGDHLQILQSREALVDRARFRHEANLALHFNGLGKQIMAAQRGRSRGGGKHPSEHLQRGSLPRPIGPQEAHDLSRRHLKLEAINRYLLTKIFCQGMKMEHAIVSPR